MPKGEVVFDGLGAGEGPCWRADGTLVVTSVDRGVLYRIWPEQSRADVFARTGGGPNGATPTTDGGYVVTQNGGFDFRLFGLATPPPEQVDPGLQLVAADGTVSRLLGGLQSPNDLVVAPDGTLYFTDPPSYPFEAHAKAGRIWALAPGSRSPQLAASGFVYCNGIGVSADGAVLTTDHGGVVRLDEAGERPFVLQHPSGVDGFCLDAEGRIYAALPGERGVRVFENGRSVEFLPVPGADTVNDGEVMWCTNCCFGGEDGRTLFATTAFPGRLIAWEGMPSPGAPVHAWAAR